MNRNAQMASNGEKVEERSAMAELIWVGNILLPRGLVFTAAALIALTAIGTLVYLTR